MAAATGDGERLLHLKLAFLAMEPPACILTLARNAGEGSITPHVQNFILESCISINIDGAQNYTYVTTILKKIIAAVESSSDTVIDELYAEFGFLISSKTDNRFLNGNNKMYKEISFVSSMCDNILLKPISMVARLLCSTNMLEGDTGCSLWPSSLYLSEFILSYPKIFSNKCCLELGSGVGLVGVCLNYVGASKVVLTDGDTCTLTNMKINMEINNLCVDCGASQLVNERNNKVECKYLSWEHATESDLWDYKPHIVLGADIIYDPLCVPHLVRVLSILLRQGNKQGNDINIATTEETHNEVTCNDVKEGPVAYMATIFRNPDTFNCFAEVAADANLSVVNTTNTVAPSSFLPYMLSYDRSSVQLLKITALS